MSRLSIPQPGITIGAALAVLAGALELVTPHARTVDAAASTFTAVADTYVDSGSASTNYGKSVRVVVDNSPVRRTLLKFTVSGLAGSVTSAKLRLHTNADNAGSSSGGTYRAMTDTGWSETGVTWNNQPTIDGVTLGSLGAVAKSNWYEVDVTRLVTGSGTFSIGGTSSSGDGAYFDTRESGANGPRLVVVTGAVSPSPSASPSPSSDPVLVGAGDIASCTSSGDETTANLLDSIPGTVFTAGDNAYLNGSRSDFIDCYDPTWGRHKARTRPAVGNHEYRTSAASAYFDYFGAAAGEVGKGYYSYDLGTWHIVVVNSNCLTVACSPGSAQEQWLRADLATSARSCTLAIWHHPLFTSGSNHGPATEMRPIFQALYDFNADVLVTGHNHQYERFAPQNPAGVADTVRGIREFVAGMGGASHYTFGTIAPNSQARNGDTYGVLKLTLHANGYDWQFVPEAGKTFSDTGSGACH